jgi:protein CrcB
MGLAAQPPEEADGSYSENAPGRRSDVSGAPHKHEARDEELRRAAAVPGRREPVAAVTTSAAVVYLVRHGRTPLNAAGLLRGRIDTPLDPVGQHEARSLAEVFADIRLSAIVASPLARARDTAAAIAATTGLPVTVDAGLADRDYGPWAGTSQAAVEAEFGSLDAAPGVEAAEEFSRRVIDAIARAAAAAESGPAVVAHEAVNRHVIANLVPSLGAVAAIQQRTGCWNRLEREDGRWSAPIVNALPADGRRPGRPSEQTSRPRRNDSPVPGRARPPDQPAAKPAGIGSLTAVGVPEGMGSDPLPGPGLRARRPARRASGRPQPGVLAVIAVGGMLGAAARYGVAQWLPSRPGRFPWATLWTNLSGSFLLGLVLVLLLERFPPTRLIRPFLATGILGAFTTMSTYEVETALLIKDGHPATGITYGVGSVVAGLVLAYLGILAGRRIHPRHTEAR